MTLLEVLSLLCGAVLVMASPASAATLTEVTDFGTNPSQLRMFVYVPDNVVAKPAIVVAVHYCHGDGPAFFNGSQFGTLASQYGSFILIFPSVTQATDGCFDVASTAALTRGGGSDPVGIRSMITYAEQHYNGDPGRVYVTGVSSGAMMTNVLVGDYPDVFKAGSAFAGVPFGCFAVNPDALRWSTACATGTVTHTAQEWGDIARAAYPGYTGPRPRMQLWHGTADTTLSYVNFGEEIKQWTNVLGVSQTPTSTDTPASGTTRTRYADSAGTVQVEAYSLAGVSHNLPVDAAAAIHFFGLDTTAPTITPTITPTTTPPTTPTSTGTGTGTCTATYAVTSSWTGGFVASVKVAAATSAIKGWKVTLALPSGTSVTNSWNGQLSGTSGTVTVTNLGYNGALAAGQSTEFGFQGSGSGTGVTATCAAS